MNQWAFRHSARNLPLNDAMKALSVGFSGREKSSVTPRWYAHRSESRCHKLGGLVDPNRCQESYFSPDPFQHFHDVGAAEGKVRLHCRQEPRERVDDGENPQLAAGRN
jgi:hypothetical protein